jgi:DNA-3-methyladenine glycosylase II
VTPTQYLQQADPKLALVIEKVGVLEEDHSPHESYFLVLSRIIIGQQLSVAVAGAIWNRVAEFFGDKFSPEAILNTPVEELRKLGLSGQKASYLQSLATHISEGTMQIDKFDELSDEEIGKEILAVKGLGPWSVHMFLMFTMKRPDILPVGDLGIREAIKRIYDLEERPNPAQMEQIAKVWRPHRTLASRYLWRSLDNTPKT